MTRGLVVLVLAGLAYPLTLASFDPWDVGFGLLATAALLVAFRKHLFPGGLGEIDSLGSRILWLPLIAAAAVREITVGTWQVALIVLHLRPLRRPGIVVVPYGERTPGGLVATAVVVTLSPGEVLVELDDDRRAMLLHVIDASDPDAVRDQHERFYRRFQRRVFP